MKIGTMESAKKTLEVVELLRRVITRRDDQRVQYAPDWDDERVGKELGVSMYVVRRLRQEQFGVVKLKMGRAAPVGLESRVEALEDRLRWLEKELGVMK